ncbi:MAG: 50S ribosomal protein L21 [Thermoanaerobaculia bacterium]|nr:50S ribosomal protein L21 [Thermoanaerobaculia bacterium]
MYAIIETGGKQYRVAAGDTIDVELDALSGSEAVEFDKVLLVGGEDGVRVGAPLVSDAKVRGTAMDEIRGAKVRVFKKKRRKGYKRLQGHRQGLLRVRIDAIEGGA